MDILRESFADFRFHPFINRYLPSKFYLVIFGLKLTYKKIILQILQEHRGELNQYGVVSVGLFGSYVRNEQNKNCDIDLLLDFELSAENFDNYMHVCAILEQIFFGEKIEIVTKNGLSPYIGPSILNEVVYA